MSNEKLVTLIKAGENTSENMQILYLQVKAFIHVMAMRYQGHAELDDLEQEGYLALYPAIDGYDPERGVKFLTYAEYYIRQAMQRYILANKSSLRLSYHSHDMISKYKRFCNLFQQKYGYDPPDEAAEYYLYFTLNQIREIRQNMLLDCLKSLDMQLADEEDTTLGEMISSGEDLESDVADRLDQERLQAILWPMVDRLPDLQPAVIRMRYQQNMTRKEIGEACGVTMEEIRQSERKGMQALRRSRGARQLKAFLPETAEAQAYRGNGVERFNRTWTSSTERVALQLSL